MTSAASAPALEESADTRFDRQPTPGPGRSANTASMLDAVFGPNGNVTWLQECARAAAIFAYGLVAVRVAGRRVFGQWTALDIIVAIVTGSSLSRALTGNADVVGTMAATTLLMVLHAVLAHLCARAPALSRLVEGVATPIARDGQLDDGALRRNGISGAAIEQALRAAGLAHASESRLIVLEPSGRISVLKPKDD